MHTGRSGSTDGPACDINIPKVGLAGRVNPTITEAQGGNLFYGINALIIALIGGLYAGYAEDTPADTAEAPVEASQDSDVAEAAADASAEASDES